MSFATPLWVKWEYRVQRLGFVCFVGVALAALFGLLGDRARVVVNTSAIYLILLLIFRVAGRRTLAETSSFDLVLLLIIGETTQQTMIGEDDSLTTALVAILTLVSFDMAITHLKTLFPALERVLEGQPVLLIHEGALRRSVLEANGLDEEDVLEAARLSHGLTSMEDVRQAAIERDGQISIVPWRRKRA